MCCSVRAEVCKPDHPGLSGPPAKLFLHLMMRNTSPFALYTFGACKDEDVFALPLFATQQSAPRAQQTCKSTSEASSAFCRVLARVPSTSRAIQSRLEVILQLIAQLMPVVQLQQSTLLPLLRVACQALTVQGLDLLQIKAAGVAAGNVRSHPNHLPDQHQCC